MIRWTGLAPWEFEFPSPDAEVQLTPMECAPHPNPSSLKPYQELELHRDWGPDMSPEHSGEDEQLPSPEYPDQEGWLSPDRGPTASPTRAPSGFSLDGGVKEWVNPKALHPDPQTPNPIP